MMISTYDHTGRIVGCLTLPDDPEIAQAQSPTGGGYLDGHYDPASYYVAADRAVQIPDAPGDWAIWDWDARAWTDPRDAAWQAAQAEAALAALRSARDARIAAVQWRIQRWRDERDLGIIPTTDDGAALLAYVQALRDLPETTDPAAPVWPVLSES